MSEPRRETATDVEPALSPTIGAVGRALPPHRYSQDELIEALERLWSEQHYNPERLRRFHENVRVGGRNLALPLEDYFRLEEFGQKNDAFIRVGTELAQEAIEDALSRAGLAASDVDAIFFTTVTGLATPTIDARLLNRLGFRRDVKRTPMFGLGCVAGAAGVARMSDYLQAFPHDVALLVSVELCSLTLQPRDLSVTNLIASGLFGDGAAVAVGVGARRAAELQIPGPRVVATRSVFYPETEWVMGWDVGSDGFTVVLSARLPELIRQELRADVDSFLESLQTNRGELDRWVAHPGGPAVLQAMQDALEVDRREFEVTWRSLEEIGNLSSASVLFVLAETLELPISEGETALMMAMGPGFCAEMVMLRW